MGLTIGTLTMLALFVLALAACALAQDPQPCSGPASFTARFRHFDRERGYYVEGKMYYDKVNRRIREFEKFDINRTDSYYDRLKLYDLNTEYSVDLKTRNCSVYPPRPEWHPWGVPPPAQYIGSGTARLINAPTESVTVDIFAGKFDPNSDAFFEVTVTRPDCFLVEMTVKHGDGRFEDREFYDTVAGIVDPSAFVPPEACVR